MASHPDTPGVYLTRDDRAARGVVSLRTDVAAFTGIAERGPLAAPVRVETFRQFEAVFGGCIGSGYLAYAVRAFFENGGRTCLALRVASDDPELGAAAAGITLQDVAGVAALRLSASSPGSWGDGLAVIVNPAWRAETTAVAPPLLAEWLTVANTDGFAAGDFLRISQPGGPDAHRLLRLVEPGPRRLHFDAAVVGMIATAPVRIEVLEYDVAVQRNGMPAALYARLSLSPRHPRHIGTVLRARYPDDQGRLEGVPPLLTASLAETATLRPLDVTAGEAMVLRDGRDGLGGLTAADFVAALGLLEPLRDVSVLAVPDIHIQPVRGLRLPYTPPTLDPCALCPQPALPAAPIPPPEEDLPPPFGLVAIEQVQAAMLEQCERLRDRVALLDPPFATIRNDALGIGGLQAWGSRFDSSFGALYAPWIAVPDPLQTAPTRMIPPSGHVAGQLAATDLASGPHCAAANVPLVWAQRASLDIDPVRHGLLNAEGVNIIAARDGRPLRILGARTVSSDPTWRFFPVRRLICMLRRALDAATQWAVFEPNDEETRALLTQSIGIFLESLREGGALAGARPVESYRVRCDETNNPPAGRGRGELVVDIAVAPSIPFEFILLRLGRLDQSFELVEQGRLVNELQGAA
ncbi:phage tail sheath family protein [Falsiroseomonas sp. E2-1-a4]|uniref:phage tail sheath family protein n=1 Tax=Falsiroseomonas sp. E2-1-a4 TaxID=3239299 RepID=UPI003F322E91